jgi:hypothetical protein
MPLGIIVTSASSPKWGEKIKIKIKYKADQNHFFEI